MILLPSTFKNDAGRLFKMFCFLVLLIEVIVMRMYIKIEFIILNYIVFKFVKTQSSRAITNNKTPTNN